MTKLEVQYAVRSRRGGNWYTYGIRYTGPEGRWHCESFVTAARPGEEVEVVAQVVMVAGDWTDPDTAEQVVRDEQDREQRREVPWAPAKVLAMKKQGLSVAEISRRTGATVARVRVNLKRAEEEAAARAEREEVPAGIVSFEGELSAEEMAEFAERWRAAGGPESVASFVNSSHRPEPTPEGRLYCAACGRMIVNSNGVTASGADACEGWRSDRG